MLPLGERKKCNLKNGVAKINCCSIFFTLKFPKQNKRDKTQQFRKQGFDGTTRLLLCTRLNIAVCWKRNTIQNTYG
jgi:hypothetical protein